MIEKEYLGSGLAFQHSIYSNAFQIMLRYKTWYYEKGCTQQRV